MRLERLFPFRKPHKFWLALALLATLCLFLLGQATAAPASSYSIDWFTVDAGGGSSAGGAYQLTGGIAQPEGGLLAGGNYQMQGGFWQQSTYTVSLPLVMR